MVRYDSDTDSFIPINFDEYTIQYTVEVSDESVEKIADAVVRKLADHKTELQKTCDTCKYWKYIAHEWQCETIKCQGYTPKTEPQTGREERR